MSTALKEAEIFSQIDTPKKRLYIPPERSIWKPIFKGKEAYQSGDILIPERNIQGRIGELARAIVHDYDKQSVVLIGVLNGAEFVHADLARALFKEGMEDVEFDFIKVGSYAVTNRDSKTTTATEKPKLHYSGNTALKGRNGLVVDDIFDTGKSLAFILPMLSEMEPESLRSLTLLDKPVRREVDFAPDYVGFRLRDDVWVEGYGLDSFGKGRHNPNIVKGPYMSELHSVGSFQ